MYVTEQTNHGMKKGFEEEEKQQCSMYGVHYDPGKLSVDAYEVKRHSFCDMENF
nr:hypothetical protein [Tanacetum cinerariifolium]